MKETFEDTDLMPFGKHKGTPMQDVPADYFHWLWFNGKKDEVNTCPIAKYIKRSIPAFKIENRNLIW